MGEQRGAACPPPVLEQQAYTPLPCLAGGPEHERSAQTWQSLGGGGAENETLEDASPLPPSNRCKLNKSAPRNQGGVGSAAKESGLCWVFREVGTLAVRSAGGDPGLER